MAFGREIKMEFERVKVSPEMVGIVGGWLTVLVFVWNLGQDMSEFRTEVSGEITGLRTEMSGKIAHLNERVARLSERVAHVEGLLQGYIDRFRAEDMAVTTE